MKSGKALKEFRGHSSFVNDAHFTIDGNHVITASSDGAVRIWSAKSAECQHTFKPFLPNMGIVEDIPVLAVHINPKQPRPVRRVQQDQLDGLHEYPGTTCQNDHHREEGEGRTNVLGRLTARYVNKGNPIPNYRQSNQRKWPKSDQLGNRTSAVGARSEHLHSPPIPDSVI